jgi:acetolactate synthase-1/2/3 large subunit
MRPNARSGAQILVEQLRIHGADLAFGVPGESYLAVLDALYETDGAVRYVICRHEAAAANMAEAYGKLTGRPGLCFVTRGPGATHASTGLHTARQDSTPMILFIGQVARGQIEREAFQEIDYRRMFGEVAKWVGQIDDPARIPEFVSRAFHTAVNGRPGPVVLALPEDMLTEVVDVADAPPFRPAVAAPAAADMAALQALLSEAKRPLLLVGGGGWSATACADLQRFAERFDLPTAAVFRRQDLLDNDHPLYVGDVGLGINPALAAHIREADLLIALGPRLGETTTDGYKMFAVPRPQQTLVHVHASAEELGRVYAAHLPINAQPAAFLTAALEMPALSPPWRAWGETLRKAYLGNLVPPAVSTKVDVGAIVAGLAKTLPRDSIICNGAGNFATWVHRYYRYGGFRTQLAPTSGAMGYGFPAAVAAKLTHPERTVVAFAGDGDFLMNSQEMATAMQYGLAVLVIVVNNSSYGTIRMHQERHYPGHVYGTDIANPDFVALARAYGGFAERVETTDAFWPALERARQANRLALIELVTDVEIINTRTTLSAIRAAAKAPAHSS